MYRTQKMERLAILAVVVILCVIGIIYVSKDSSSIGIHKWDIVAEKTHSEKQWNEMDVNQKLKVLEEKLKKAMTMIEEVSCRATGIGSRGGFCLTKENLEVGGNWAWDPVLANHMEKLLDNQQVGDFGAGLGWYGRFFLRTNDRYLRTAPQVEDKYFFNNTQAQDLMKQKQRIASWTGYDGATFVSEVTNGLVHHLDLSEPFTLSRKFDWIISLEVGEHIPIEFEHNFLNNIDKHACKGVILSWAVPGQGGHYHVNNRPREYIIEQMAKRGFKSEDQWAEKFRNISQFSWFQGSIMTFSRVQVLQHPLCPNSSSAVPEITRLAS